jgi:hypothetical protein
VEVELTEPGDASWNGLTAAFRPYFQQRMEKVATGYYSGCNAPASKIQLYDLVFSSMPWVTNYDKGTVMVLPSWVGYLTFFPIKAGHLSSTAGQAFRTNAMWAGTVGLKGTDTCSLSSSSITGLPDMGRIYYNLAFSRYVYLFKYAPGSGKLGTCKVDDKTYIPQQQKFCKESAYGYGSCTEYDETTVSAAGSLGRSVYMPYYTANVEGPRYKSQSYICSGVGNEGTIACSNTGITDVAEYSGVATTTGAPRTFPEASTLKERIGNYLKSGVMPVIDLSSGSNWGRINPAGDLLDSHGTPWFLRNSSTRLYTEYDFERLFGEMGALLVIVEHVDGPSDADSKLETIIDRSGIVRDKCLTCLTAVHVDGPASNTTFGQTVAAMMSDPRANLNVDMVTFDYTVSRHPPPATAIGLQNKSIAVAEDIASYGSASLEAGGKPTMVVGLNVYDNDTLWNTDYGILFETIVGKQGLLVQAGVSGIIYSPARSVKLGPKPAPSGNPWYDAFINSIYNTLEPQSGKGVVAAPLETQVGVKTQKFCALQGALQKMSASPPVAVFSRLAPKDVECIPCTSIDYAKPGQMPGGGGDAGLPDVQRKRQRIRMHLHIHQRHDAGHHRQGKGPAE